MSNQDILVSVIVPVYNAQAYLADCLDSLLTQEGCNLEIIAVNDGSQDSSADILNFYAKEFSQIRVINQTNQGSWNSRLAGIKQAKGEYLGFCDSDDIALPDMYQKLLAKALQGSAEITVSAYYRIDSITNRIVSTEMTGFNTDVYKVRENPGFVPVVNSAVWNKLFKTCLLQQVVEFANPPRKYLEDFFLFASILPNVQTIAFLDEPLYNYRVRPQSNMSSLVLDDAEPLFKYFQAIREFYCQFDVNTQLVETVDLMAFIHLGISLLNLISYSEGQSMRQYEKMVRTELSAHFPLYSSNAFTSLTYNMQNNWQNLRPTLALWAFKLHLLVPMISLYKKVTKLLGKEFRW